jgi:undecaprenyl-diphosphatase
MTIDVQPVGQNGTDIGFAVFNVGFHEMTGVNMTLYTITDWLGLVPIFICMIFGGVGFIQLIKRKSLFKVDKDIIILGIYYIIVIMAYLIFEMIPINYRPIPIEGVMEASYPSSTTLLVLSVMPTLVEQAGRRLSDDPIKKLITIFVVLFSLFMVIGRLISGVHWFTDIVGSVLLSIGLYYLYKGCVLSCRKEA